MSYKLLGEPGGGMERAAKRLRDKRRENQNIPDPDKPISRQVRRQRQRLLMKDTRAVRL